MQQAGQTFSLISPINKVLDLKLTHLTQTKLRLAFAHSIRVVCNAHFGC